MIPAHLSMMHLNCYNKYTMLDEKWQGIISRIQDEFQVLEHNNRVGDIPGETIEEISFLNPAGTFKLVRSVRPRLVGEKTQYSNRIGGHTSIEKVYSQTEKVDVVKLFRQTNGDWVAMEADQMF